MSESGSTSSAARRAAASIAASESPSRSRISSAARSRIGTGPVPAVARRALVQRSPSPASTAAMPPIAKSPGGRQPPAHDRRELDRPLPCHRAEAHRAVLLADVVEPRDRVEVDQRARPAEAEVEQRHQALAAGQELGVAAVAREQRDGLLDAG